jgi:hypothetical protein
MEGLRRSRRERVGDRALERLRTDVADDETHDVAAEALLTIRGLSLGAAESLLRDAAFPADPFAP